MLVYQRVTIFLNFPGIFLHFSHTFPHDGPTPGDTFEYVRTEKAPAGWSIWLLVGLFQFEGLPHHPHHTAGEGRPFGPHLPLRDGLPYVDLFDSSYIEVAVLGPHVVGADYLCLLVRSNTHKVCKRNPETIHS